MHPRLRSPLGFLALVALAAATSCGPGRPPVDPSYRAEIEQWRAAREARLTADDGWLTVVALDWLRPGVNRIGSGSGNDVVLPGSTPADLGTIELAADGTVLFHNAAGAAVTIGGAPVTDRRLATDRDGTPDVIAVGSVHAYVIARGDQFAVRVKDTEAEARRRFRGLTYFPIDPRFRVNARFERYPLPRPVQVPSAHGPDQTMYLTGIVRFNLLGVDCSLEPLQSDPRDKTLFFVFRDFTTGRSTYPAGRFLDADAPDPGTGDVILDFNRAINPPCAFTPFATCPLPPPGNTLKVGVLAGEKIYADR